MDAQGERGQSFFTIWKIIFAGCAPAADDAHQRLAFRHRQRPRYVPAWFHFCPLIVHKSKSGGGPPLFKTLARWLHHLRARAKPMSLPKDRKSFKAC
jgi:hypothetical protein